MRFGQTLSTAVYPPWQDRYIDYAKLKTLLREGEVGAEDVAVTQDRDARGNNEWTERDEENFVQELINVQLDKVNQFHIDTYRALLDRTAACEAKLEPVTTDRKGPNDGAKVELVQSTLKELDSISKEVASLQKYDRLNFTGFLKAAKKHDRKRGLKYRVRPILEVRLAQTPFHSENYSSLLFRLQTIYSFAHQQIHGGEGRTASQSGPQPTESYTAHKYWVHEDNVLEVKTNVLRRLPVLIYNPQSSKILDSSQKDPDTTSIYFDSPYFDLYTQKVDRAAEAGSLRIRWSGPLRGKPDIQLEKKVVSSLGESRELRVHLKEKYVRPFLRGEYAMEKSVRKLEERYGVGSDQVKTLKSNVEELQSIIREKQLKPVLRASYTRTAYQIPGDDRIRVSIDTNLALIREDTSRSGRDTGSWHRTDIDDSGLEFPYSSINPNEISRFPYALLEIKVKDSRATRSNAWLADLMSSHLVKEVPRFSKFVHGVALLFEDSVNIFPFWLSELDADIRRDPETAFEEEQQKQADKAQAEFAVGSFLSSSKMPGSPVPRGTFGSMEDNAPVIKSRQSPPSLQSRPHLCKTVEDNGNTGGGQDVQILVSDSFKTHSQRLFPTFSTSKYARRHRQGGAREDAALAPGVVDPGNWIKDSGPVKVEAKVWLANQRTFIKWQHIAVLLASLSLALYNAAGVDNNTARALAVVYTGFAAFGGVWGWWVYMWRSKLIMERSGRDFDNSYGPFVISVGLTCALCLNFGFQYSTVVPKAGFAIGVSRPAINNSAWAGEL